MLELERRAREEQHRRSTCASSSSAARARWASSPRRRSSSRALPGAARRLPLRRAAISPACCALFREARARRPSRSCAYEFFTERCLARVRRHRKRRVRRFEQPVEPLRARRGRGRRGASALEAWVARALRARPRRTTARSRSTPRRRRELWALREGDQREPRRPPACRTRTTSRCPIAALEAFCAELEALLRRALSRAGRSALFGHIGDGNLHVNVMKPDALDKAEFLARDQGGRPRHLRAGEAARRAASPPSTASAC